MTEWIKALVYGLVEGITEWLPVSSTGHLILLERFFALEMSDSFRSFYLVAIQIGASLASLAYFAKFLLSRSLAFNRSLLMKMAVSSIPAAIVGVFFDDLIDAYFYNTLTVSVMLILFGIVFLFVDAPSDRGKSLAEIRYRDAAVIGIFQLIAAVFPGVSRSGATIIGGLKCGLSRKTAAEYTFIMAIPVMLGAGFLKMLKLKEMPTGDEIRILLIGAVTAFAVSVFVIRGLIRFVQKHSFKGFGYYRILLGIGIFLTFLVS